MTISAIREVIGLRAEHLLSSEAVEAAAIDRAERALQAGASPSEALRLGLLVLTEDRRRRDAERADLYLNMVLYVASEGRIGRLP